MKYDVQRLQTAFHKISAKQDRGYEAVAAKARVSPSTVHRIVNFGMGRPQNVDRVCRVLGFKRGHLDVLITGKHTAA